MIKEPLISKLPRNTINLHGGLSPKYRGVATMFWPFYFLEPNHVGATFHYLTESPDTGSIIHQSIPKLEYNDKIHDVSCKAIISASRDMIKLLSIYEKENGWRKNEQKTRGKNFLDSDFKPEHLRIIYNLFNDDIVKEFLSGKIKSPDPKLITQF
jgi:methionyl-tRNA formyltransferase